MFYLASAHRVGYLTNFAQSQHPLGLKVEGWHHSDLNTDTRMSYLCLSVHPCPSVLCWRVERWNFQLLTGQLSTLVPLTMSSFPVVAHYHCRLCYREYPYILGLS